MKRVYVYAIICVVLILIGVGGYYFFTKGKVESGEPETIVIGGQEEQTSGTENYMSLPDTTKVPASVSEYTVIAYDPESTSPNFASSWKENEECPGGGYDCLYMERVNENGRVTAITDKDGNDFLQNFTDDLYDGKLKWIDDMIRNDPGRIRERYRLSDDNKLMFKVDDKWVRIEPGVKKDYQLKDGGVLTQNMNITEYLIHLLVLYKTDGKPKPNVVIDLPAVKRQVIVENSEDLIVYGPEDPRHPDHPSNKNVQPIPDSERKEKIYYKK